MLSSRASSASAAVTGVCKIDNRRVNMVFQYDDPDRTPKSPTTRPEFRWTGVEGSQKEAVRTGRVRLLNRVEEMERDASPRPFPSFSQDTQRGH